MKWWHFHLLLWLAHGWKLFYAVVRTRAMQKSVVWESELPEVFRWFGEKLWSGESFSALQGWEWTLPKEKENCLFSFASENRMFQWFILEKNSRSCEIGDMFDLIGHHFILPEKTTWNCQAWHQIAQFCFRLFQGERRGFAHSCPRPCPLKIGSNSDLVQAAAASL